VKSHAAHVVRWAVQRLKRDFFAREPERILDVWLFRICSHESNALALRRATVDAVRLLLA
jgi:hypothetical protein